jgi:hypothetical protein
MTKIKYKQEAKYSTKEWHIKMSKFANILNNKNVKLITFVHGAFARKDPLGLLNFLQPIIQNLPHENKISAKPSDFSEKHLKKFSHDVGCFTEDYKNVFSSGIGENSVTSLFSWTGGNYHLARLKGAVDLISDIAANVRANKICKKDRILLLGHSHGGQLFALITLFLEDGNIAKKLYNIVEKSPHMQREDLIENLLTIDGIPLDFVTFGTPVRYKWGVYDNYRLLSIINHRSLVQPMGLLEIKDGDYIQQWAIAGTDIMPPLNELSLNDSLDSVLDKGRDITVFVKRLQRKRRQKEKTTTGKLSGKTLLVDYRDNDPNSQLFDKVMSFPKLAIKTQFGHGVYTLKNAILFNAKLIEKYLYSAK